MEENLKLEIFQGYIKEWLSVFSSKKTFNAINIFDFSGLIDKRVVHPTKLKGI